MRLADYANRYNTIRFERSDAGVLEVTMHTRGGDALWGTNEQSLHAELGPAFADLARDSENKVVILTGTGRTFLTGLDPEERGTEKTQPAMWQRIAREGVTLLEDLLEIPVPMIAAINGPVVIYAELAALCDIVLAADHAEISDSFHFTKGVVPGDGVHTVWPMLLGPNRGRYFLLTGEILSAQEAKQLGVVAEVLPLADLLPRARVLANQLAQNTHMMLRHTRTLFTRNLRQRMRDELELGLALEAHAAIAKDAGLS